MHLVMRGHFWSHDKDGSHTTAENPHATRKLNGSMFYRSETIVN